MDKPDIDPARLLENIYNSTLDHCICTLDLEGRINSWNVGAERITGFSREDVMGRDNAMLFTPEDQARGEPEQEMSIARTTGRAADYRWHLHKDGSRYWADGVMTPIIDAGGRHIGYLKIFRDITDRKIAEAELHRIANQDMLTGLANRYAFEAHAEELLSIAGRGGHTTALHLVDLDGFKQVNDSLGHHQGDALLQQTAQRMRQILRESDFVARLGGDEFVVMQPNLASMQAAAELAAKLVRALSQPFFIAGHEVTISASIGISASPDDARDLDQLLKKADLALYRAKEEGKGRFHYFTEKLDSAALKKSSELANVRHAVESRQFRLEYQPKIAFDTGQTVGTEALLRCTNPALAGHSMEQIVELAAEAGLMKGLSLWVLREACAQMKLWKDRGLNDLKMAVNLCAQDLTDEKTPTYLDTLIREMALAPSDLEIEITEREALDVERNGCEVLGELRERGIGIALDDFGTGYSALSHLRNLPVTAVKLDKSFLIDIPYDAQGNAVVKAVMSLSRALGLEVVAEGVETEAQAAFLKANHCTALQGFLISKPLSARDMTAWLDARRESVH